MSGAAAVLVTFPGESATFSGFGVTVGIISISGPSVSVDAVDVTSLGDLFKKYRAHKQKDNGTVTVECYATAASRAAFGNVGALPTACSITLGAGGPAFAFSGFILSAEVSGLDAGGSEAKITLEIQLTTEVS